MSFVFSLVVFLLLLSSCSNPSNDYTRLLTFRQKCAKILGSRSGTILAMNPRNGLVLALVNEKLGVQSSTRPGSTFKIVTALALLKNGIVQPADQFVCNGQVEIHGNTYRCWLREGHGEQNLLQALANSCNAYFFQAGESISVDALQSTARQFHLGECTGINVVGEDCGEIPEWVSEEEKINFLVGQARALAVTPIQMLRVIAAVANGGSLYRPFYPTSPQELEKFRPEFVGTIHFGDELRIIKEGLHQSVAYGTGAAAQLPNIVVAGKTGTASEYFGFKTDAWFAGFAPFEKPEIAVVVFLENGRGAMDAAPMAGKVFKKYLELN
ncbi:MAG: penicillin-binding transpeptidase domain-containing protein [candidate division KSB1 bacterium]|nr:penicillin-binding transpeptidase domain-containing protein [candidate division KSB1 bacterium]MDZ7300764.1 penicillin-binding transpeptidase domain-containing protein [candidate division KSB1 bacterium]MDZ7309966.1 penicillin-binding transpeptidase domain-containing protein [candidate division KSB1 bacterium]